MRTRPILFKGEMVRVILEDRKTQTRRVVKPRPPEWIPKIACAWMDCGVELDRQRYGFWNEDQDFPCPFGGPENRLWVREAWTPRDGRSIYYRADGTLKRFGYSPPGLFAKWESFQPPVRQRWVPSIFMPRWASRITLEITDVRVQRVQEITDADAIAEGCGGLNDTPGPGYQFATLWDSINAKRGYGWDVNPWVWAITFRRLI